MSDERKVRLLGINTPEIGRRGKPNKPGALRAKGYLKSIVLDKHVLLEQDVEHKDRYKDQHIEVRGWPRKRGKYWSIRVIHPSQVIKAN